MGICDVLHADLVDDLLIGVQTLGGRDVLAMGGQAALGYGASLRQESTKSTNSLAVLACGASG